LTELFEKEKGGLFGTQCICFCSATRFATLQVRPVDSQWLKCMRTQGNGADITTCSKIHSKEES